jgi:nitrite reductase (NADH) small subunit
VVEYRRVCPIEELPPGTGRLFRWEGVDVAVFHVDGELFAIEDTCLHAGGPLHEGSIVGTHVVCPWHHWEFDLRDGSCALNPHHKLDCYEVRVTDGVVEIGLR